MAPIVTDNRARQGPPGRPVLGVLIGGLALIAVALTGYLVWVGSTSPDSPTQDAARQSATGDPKGNPPPAGDPNATGATPRQP
jgi:hypothetical protein